MSTAPPFPLFFTRVRTRTLSALYLLVYSKAIWKNKNRKVKTLSHIFFTSQLSFLPPWFCLCCRHRPQSLHRWRKSLFSVTKQEQVYFRKTNFMLFLFNFHGIYIYYHRKEHCKNYRLYKNSGVLTLNAFISEFVVSIFKLIELVLVLYYIRFCYHLICLACWIYFQLFQD